MTDQLPSSTRTFFALGARVMSVRVGAANHRKRSFKHGIGDIRLQRFRLIAWLQAFTQNTSHLKASKPTGGGGVVEAMD